MDKLWTPTSYERHVLPEARKREGGTAFDDELPTRASVDIAVERMRTDLIAHLNSRPDHTVYVASPDEREKMRTIFNHWKRAGVIGHNPDIKIEYALADGAIRVAE